MALKTIEDVIDQLFENMDFDNLIIWADTLEVEHNEKLWLDDMWPDHETDLRVKVAETFLDAISPKTEVTIATNLLKELLKEAQCPDILHCDNGWITDTFNNEKSRCVWCVKREQALKG